MRTETPNTISSGQYGTLQQPGLQFSNAPIQDLGQMYNLKYIRGPSPCFNCGTPGHTFEVCPGPRREVCNFCYKTGHTRENCPLSALWNNQPGSATTNTESPAEKDAGIKPVFPRGPDEVNSDHVIDSVAEFDIQEKSIAKPLYLEEVIRAITLLEDPLSVPPDEVIEPSISLVEQNSEENSAAEEISDSEWEDEVETLCEPATPAALVPSQASFIPRVLQGKPLSASFIHRLASRRIFKPGNGSPPEKTSRIPTSVWIFGVKLQGILDTGSERSYINEKVYQDIKHLAAGELQDDQTKKGVLLANHSTCKSKGGAPFIIQIGSVAGEQYLSVLPDLGYSLVLGMDFATKFEVQIDCKNCTWKFTDSPEVFLFQPINCHEKSAPLCAMSELQEEEMEKFLKIELKKFDEVSNLGATKIIQHEILLKPGKQPVRIKPYRRSPVVNEELNKQIDELLEKKFIRPSCSVWSCSPLMVSKPNNKWRFCIDYRPLNKVTIPPAHPLPNMLRILSALHGATFISTMDLREAFHQILMSPDSVPLTAFSVEGRGQFEWLRMPYGLVGAPKELPLKWAEQVFAYLDDWIAISETFEEHLKVLALLFEVFREFGLLINPEKCKFCRNEVRFLGFVVNETGLYPDPERIAPVVNFPTPTNKKQLRSFLGLVNWYHRHLQNVAKAQGPLNKLTGANSEWKWGPEEEKSFHELKQALVDAQPLAIPKPDWPYVLYTDACDTGLGAFLVQKEPGTDKEHLIICLSRQLRGAETRYTTTEKECLAVVWAVRKLREPNGRLARWAVELFSHQVTIKHQRGTTNEGPDALSRLYEDDSPEDWMEIKDRLQTARFVNIQSSSWYDLKFNNVRKHPKNFPDWQIREDCLYYRRPDPLEEILGDEDEWKKVLRDYEVPEILRRNHEEPRVPSHGQN
ncbi:uncharacterized protein LOC141526500 [Cotesia typhae]|uniref:uncharacterized protein LOC141526500 n=1 Tax=Cotesia typhae TaxID=2053667 RepID=UPI003D68615C